MPPRLRSFGFVCTLMARFFVAPDIIGTPHPAGEHYGQREGKDVPVTLFSSQSHRQILGNRWATPFVPAMILLGDGGRREEGVGNQQGVAPTLRRDMRI